MTTALITGITGQDGSYLAELLLSKGYNVVGMARRSSTVNHERIEHLLDDITIIQGDLHDQGSLLGILEEHKPAEVYNLAAQSFVPASWSQAVLTAEVTALGVTRMLEAIRLFDRSIKFYQASSSEMFGKVLEVPQKEDTPFYTIQIENPKSTLSVLKTLAGYLKVSIDFKPLEERAQFLDKEIDDKINLFPILDVGAFILDWSKPSQSSPSSP